MEWVRQALDAFLLGFPTLFSIVNPINGAFGFRVLTEGADAATRERLARLVALLSLLVTLISLWAGSFILAFFGVSVAALRIAGGIVIVAAGWQLLNAPALDAIDPSEHAITSDIAVVPLTIPLTAGPGTIAVTIALGSEHPPFAAGELPFFIGMTIATVAIFFVVWFFYRSADRVAELLGPVGSRTLTRLIGFLLLSIGAQVMITGVVDVLGPLLKGR